MSYQPDDGSAKNEMFSYISMRRKGSEGSMEFGWEKELGGALLDLF